MSNSQPVSHMTWGIASTGVLLDMKHFSSNGNAFCLDDSNCETNILLKFLPNVLDRRLSCTTKLIILVH
jgi:hypothetical protein